MRQFSPASTLVTAMGSILLAVTVCVACMGLDYPEDYVPNEKEIRESEREYLATIAKEDYEVERAYVIEMTLEAMFAEETAEAWYQDFVKEATIAAEAATAWHEIQTEEAGARPPDKTPEPPPKSWQGYTCNRCIKGNISVETGEKIYHFPGCEYYEAARVNEGKGERWFSSEAEAQGNGWRKATNCP